MTTTPIPPGMKRCPRCLTPVKFVTAEHLDVCGAGFQDGNWSEPAGRWKARDYLGKSEKQQAEMRAQEIADVADVAEQEAAFVREREAARAR